MEGTFLGFRRTGSVVTFCASSSSEQKRAVPPGFFFSIPGSLTSFCCSSADVPNVRMHDGWERFGLGCRYNAVQKHRLFGRRLLHSRYLTLWRSRVREWTSRQPCALIVSFRLWTACTAFFLFLFCFLSFFSLFFVSFFLFLSFLSSFRFFFLSLSSCAAVNFCTSVAMFFFQGKDGCGWQLESALQLSVAAARFTLPTQQTFHAHPIRARQHSVAQSVNVAPGRPPSRWANRYSSNLVFTGF